ncbi:hypothetical protein C4D60_Mb10t06640 [Musa balbisiana]|uniref:Uncharacterized protein n=1 Tax=Musa balbisiana TaxID=52838 RepID=A0A4V6T468_MUSBA|nr:hypothetical protein C4D60_Mb10t06640 [Musa balbisiana]
MAFETHLRGLPACVVLLDPMTRDTPARPARLRRAPRLHVARDHACAACPPASCSSAPCSPRPHLCGQPACVVLLGSSAPCSPRPRPRGQPTQRQKPCIRLPLYDNRRIAPFGGEYDMGKNGRPGAAPQEGNKGDEICSDVSFPQTTASSFDPTHPTEAEEHVDRGVPIPCGSSVLHATPVAMSDATRGTVLPLQAATSGVGPSPRPDLCAGARRCRLSLALRWSFLPTRPPVPTRTTVLGRRKTSRDAARDPRHPDPRTEPRQPRGHGLNSCPPQQRQCWVGLGPSIVSRLRFSLDGLLLLRYRFLHKGRGQEGDFLT